MTSTSEKPDPAALAAFRQWLAELADSLDGDARLSSAHADHATANYYYGRRDIYLRVLAEFDRRVPLTRQEEK